MTTSKRGSAAHKSQKVGLNINSMQCSRMQRMQFGGGKKTKTPPILREKNLRLFFKIVQL